MAARDYIIAFTKTDKGVMSLKIPAWDDPTRKIEDDDEFLAHLQEKCLTEGVSGGLVLLSDLPTDRYFRSAWEWED